MKKLAVARTEQAATEFSASIPWPAVVTVYVPRPALPARATAGSACRTPSFTGPSTETDGESIGDASGASRAGVLQAPATRAEAIRAGGLLFDGSGGQVRLTDDPELVHVDVAIASWVRTPELTPQTQNNRDVASYGDIYALRITASGVARFFVRVSDDWAEVESVARVDDDTWHHVVGQKRGSEIEVYIDGALAAATTIAEEIAYSALPGRDFTVGMHGGDGGPFHMIGLIDEVRVFKRALTAAEVADLASR